MKNPSKPTISIVTATYNAAGVLPGLIASLVEQTDRDFEWVIADGGSTDSTIDLIEAAARKLKNVVIDSRPDFGIYDALNRALKIAKGEYYLVLGADDLLDAQAIALYKETAYQTNADIVAAPVRFEDEVIVARDSKQEWFYGPFIYMANHSVGLLIKRELHERFGFYSRKLPMAADVLFLLSVMKGGAKLKRASFISGRYGSEGTSAVDALGSMTESFRAMVAVGHSPFVQFILLAIRFLKNIRKITIKNK
jgi:glycosyltransferase involved in cell wall biosynthesis